MSSLVLVTQLADPSDPGMGFVAGLVRGLSSRFDRVWVVANEVRHPLAGENVEVISLGKERGAGKVAKAAGLARAVAVLGREREVALLAHQCPIYLDIAAPAAKWRHMPTLLWFAHPAVTPSLRVAEMASDVVLTSLPGAFPIQSRKLRVIGQAIDLDAFPMLPIEPSTRLRVVAVGRTSPSKGFATIVEALALVRDAGIDASATIVGPSLTERERVHRHELRSIIDRRGLGDVVDLRDGVPPSEVPAVLASADVLVNAMVGGSGDKVVFEAMAVGRPVVVSNPAFADLLAGTEPQLTFDHADARSLADSLVAISRLSGDRREALAAELRRRVEARHSLDHWSGALRGIVDPLVSGRR